MSLFLTNLQRQTLTCAETTSLNAVDLFTGKTSDNDGKES